jgi:hypothetical protein
MIGPDSDRALDDAVRAVRIAYQRYKALGGMQVPVQTRIPELLELEREIRRAGAVVRRLEQRWRGQKEAA